MGRLEFTSISQKANPLQIHVVVVVVVVVVVEGGPCLSM
jgi:hypothetical protein